MFHIYVLFLILSGIAMLAMAGIKTGQVTTRRIWSAILGAGFTVYGLYLLLFFQGGHYLIFYYVFIVPVLVIIRFFRDLAAGRARQRAAAFQAPPADYAQPAGYAQPADYAQPAAEQPQGPVQ